MKLLTTVLTTLLLTSAVGHAAEDTSMTDKAKAAGAEVSTEAKKMGRKTKRVAKKAMHKAEEAMCMEGDMKCAAEKAKHRVQEGKDTATDKMKDMKDEMSK